MAEIDPGEDASGHRARLRERMFRSPDALLDHELIEYLLGLSIRRGDTKPIARRLIDQFGSGGAVLSASPDALKKAGLGETSVAAIKIAEASALRLLKSKVGDRPVVSSWQALLDYLQADMAHRAVERVRVLHLNTKNVLIRDELMSEGTVDQSAIYARNVISDALRFESAAVILVHNHPSGDPSPSRQDIAVTRDIIEAGRHLNIAVHDHVVIGSNGVISMRAKGLI